MYKGEVSLSKEQLNSFLEAAKCLQIKGNNVPYYFLVYSFVFNIYLQGSITKEKILIKSKKKLMSHLLIQSDPFKKR